LVFFNGFIRYLTFIIDLITQNIENTNVNVEYAHKEIIIADKESKKANKKL